MFVLKISGIQIYFNLHNGFTILYFMLSVHSIVTQVDNLNYFKIDI